MENEHALSDHDESAGPSIPRGVWKSRGGWEGEQLELDHYHRQKQQQQQHASDRHETSVVAVDLSQFRNTVVGKGYQAKHVIRQTTGPSGNNEPLAWPVKDMTRASTTVDPYNRQDATTTPPKRRTGKRSSQHKDTDSAAVKYQKLDKYLRCEAFRRFYKELHELEVQRVSTNNKKG